MSMLTMTSDNMFVLDFVPKEYLGDGPEKSIVVFTAGWAMKFVPLLGKALAQMALDGKSEYERDEFKITRKDEKTGHAVIADQDTGSAPASDAFAQGGQAEGSCLREHNLARCNMEST
ncbi:hypothetical protein ACHAPT_001746 [Fusarium lateritium]